MLTLQEVLELDLLRESKVRTANYKLYTQQVEWVSIMDIPVENYIRKNEFVLTTGVGSGHDMDVFYQFVESVYNSGACALAVAVGKYIKEIPTQVLMFAEENGFPIIELPWEIRFAEVSHSIMTKIQKLQNKDHQMIENIQQTLLNMIVGNHNLSKIVDFLSEKIGQPLMVVDKGNVIKGKSRGSKDLIEKWNTHTSTDHVGIKLPQINRQHPFQIKIKKVNLNSCPMLQIPIQSANRIQGYLNIGLKDESQIDSFLTDKHVSILEHAATILAMWLLRENAIEETKMKLRGDFVWSLANGEFSNWDQKIYQAKSLGYVLELPYTCLIGTPENLQDLYQRSNADTSYDHWKESMFHYIQDEIFLTANIVKQKVMTTNHRNDIILFIESLVNLKKEKIHQFLELLTQRLNRLLPGVMLSWGIGRCHEGEKRFAESFNDAGEALEIGRKKKGIGCCVDFEDTRFDRALLRIMKDQEMNDIVNNTVKCLVEYDKQKNTNLIETVMVYNANQGKTSQTARDLHLHRHTLLYRLKKIESITNLSLFNPEDRFLLELSIKLWKLKGRAE